MFEQHRLAGEPVPSTRGISITERSGQPLDEIGRAARELANLKRKTRKLIKRSRQVDCSFNGIRPAAKRISHYSRRVSNVSSHWRAVTADSVIARKGFLPLLQYGWHEPAREIFGSALDRGIFDARAQQLVG